MTGNLLSVLLSRCQTFFSPKVDPPTSGAGIPFCHPLVFTTVSPISSGGFPETGIFNGVMAFLDTGILTTVTLFP
ncbi:hypothetical protein EDB86DRAFT_2948766 [Lactarius hatsudake]|nr:hypothetical protein EDB86DRAFT_2948766 [Lactarius hatsudake]